MTNYKNKSKELNRFILNKCAELEKKRSNLLKEVEQARVSANLAKEELIKYISFDREIHTGELLSVNSEILTKKSEADHLHLQKSKIDELIAPIMSQIDLDKAKLNVRRSNREHALRLESGLSYATNSYERALIHQECEETFGTGSPRAAITRFEKEIKHLERNLEKAYRRFKEMIQRALRQVDSLVIDGNNLCYSGSRFIGILALMAIVPVLKQRYSILIIFDSDVRSLLRKGSDSVLKCFSEQVDVHVVASGVKADETIVKLASTEEFSYILSNDRFNEFKDSAAISNHRLIRHEIVGERIIIHDLNIDLYYDHVQKDN